jgi:hypothetical protein
MGVRDALRMVDSFIKWARKNEDRAKALDDFIHDGLIAAAKRCESCLKDDLGLSFADDEGVTDESQEIKQVPSGYETRPSQNAPYSEEPSDEEFEVAPDDMSPGLSEVSIESEDDSISIDAVGRLEAEEMEDISMDGPPREFSSDFDLVEPSDLVADNSAMNDETSSSLEPEVEDEMPEDTEPRPSFTWADYEKAVTPPKEEPEAIDDSQDFELPPRAKMDFSEETTETASVPKPPELPTDEIEPSRLDEEDIDADEIITKPPPPPPPPDGEEDEEERRRRARRLFFGD